MSDRTRSARILRELVLWLHLSAPLGLAFGLVRWLEAAFGRSAPPGGALLVAGAGLLAYAADRWPRIGLSARDNPTRSGLLERRRPALALVAAFALTLVGAGLRRRGWPTPGALAVLAPPTLAYPWLKRRFLLKNLAVPFVWAGALGWVAFDGPSGAGEGAALAALFLLLAAGTLLCDLKDAAGDRALGFGGAAARFGPARARDLARTLLVLVLAQAAWPALGPSAARAALAADAALLLALSFRPSWLERELAAPALVDWTLAACGLLAACWG